MPTSPPQSLALLKNAAHYGKYHIFIYMIVTTIDFTAISQECSLFLEQKKSYFYIIYQNGPEFALLRWKYDETYWYEISNALALLCSYRPFFWFYEILLCQHRRARSALCVHQSSTIIRQEQMHQNRDVIRNVGNRHAKAKWLEP